jgi:isoleucyl-tRNA synthetase
MPGERDDLGVFTAEWYDGLFEYSNTDVDVTIWDSLEQVRTEVTRTLEGLRQDGQIGSSLDADVTINADPALAAQLRTISDELRFVMITSSATVAELDPGADSVTLRSGMRVSIAANASPHQKCARCWHHREEVGNDEEHPELCGRCIDNIEGAGEQRRYA